MKTKIKRHSRSVLSVVLAISILVSCMMVGLIASDAAKITDNAALGAKADDEAVGYSNKGYVKGDWDSWATPDDNKGHLMTGSGYTVHLAANTVYKFVFAVADNDDIFRKDMTFTSSVTNYDFPKSTQVDSKIQTTIEGDYTFKFTGFDGGQTCMKADITFPTSSADVTWTAVGAYGTSSTSDAGFFGTAWAPTATANDMTQSGTTWSKTWNNVTFSSSTTVYYKVAKNHAWDTAYPSSNATKTIPAGTYNITITYNESNNAVDLTYTSIAKSTLTVGSPTNATITATYNGTSATNGGTITQIPQGATVNITVAPSTGYQCTGITSSGGGTISGSINSYTLTMPAANTTVNATIETVTLKRIYFNNNYTQYGTVYAYVYNKTGDTKTYEYLGARPGKVMTEPENSEMWYIQVPSNITYVEFISGDGKTTGEMEIPWNNTNPKYIAPYNYNAPTVANGGTWGNYAPGDKVGDSRDNVYNVSKGSTMGASNLFTGITATMYDYYTDGEIAASAGTSSDDGGTGSPNGWIKGINSDEYTWQDSGWKWIPYTKLNGALSAYADADKKSDGTTSWSNPHQPKYGITYPLYFGNLNYNADASEVSGYYNYNKNVNNSTGLTHNNNAVTGLSGKILGDDDTIHYFDASDTTNENGAPMAMFNEDFLSGENSEETPLATILRTSSFPVRKEDNIGGSVTGITKIYLDANKWSDSNAAADAYFWGSNLAANFYSMTLDASGNYYVVNVPSGAEKVIFTRAQSHVTSFGNNDSNIWNKSNDITLHLSGSTAINYYTCTSITNKTFTESLDTTLDGCTMSGGHTYYEYDSTNGKDNAYIQNIDKSDKTAEINYYNNTNKVHSNSNTDGFFPFNRSGLVPDTAHEDYAQDLGFGMKLEIPFTLNGSGNNNGINEDGTDQTFDFSGDDDLWVFVDGKLVLDLGGAHARTTGSINFHTKTVTANDKQAIDDDYSRNGSFADGFNTNPNYVHTMTIYYMERGMFDSNLKFGFSFHAIPNQFWIDKKVRTKDRNNLGHDTINAGFFTNNNQTGDASNMTTHTLGEKTTTMSKFEKSFQDESFTVTHYYGASTPDTSASGLNYTIDYNDQTQTVDSNGQYPIYHDKGNAFIAQFDTGDKFNLKETISSSNKYVYIPEFSVWDQANNDKAITPGGNNTDGYTFDFSPTNSPASGGIENTNIKARFENYMVAHDLILTKELTNTTDTTSTFTFQILFDFTGTNAAPNYVSYPLYCDVDGVRTQLSDTGTITVKAGQVIDIFEIPENAKIQITEVLTDTINGYRYNGFTLTKGGNTVQPTENVTKGIVFAMGDDDMTAVVSNKKPNFGYTIKYNYTPYVSTYTTQSYTVKGVFTETERNTYLTLDGSGNPIFKNADAKRLFVNAKAPYEDNFQQTLSFENSTIVDTGEGKGWANDSYTCEVTAQASSDSTISAYFYLPYAVDSNLVPQESGTSGRVAKIANAASGNKEINCFDWYVTSGKKNKRDTSTSEAAVYVKAPLIIYTDVTNDSTAQYFQYWSVKKQSSYGMKSNTEYTRCYDYEFNFALFMDCIIEPVYASTWAQTSSTPPNPNPPTTYNMYNRYDPELQIRGDSTNQIKIAFLENSRNQYNNDDNGGRTASPHAADVVYSDFLLNFNYVAGTQKLRELDANTKRAGLVVEAVNYMEYDSTHDVFNTGKDYSTDTDYTTNESSQRSAIITWLQGGTKPTGCAKSEFDVHNKLDNKNCIQYYYSLNNRSYSSDNGGQLVNNLQNRYKVFRAYAYIGDVSGGSLTKVQLSDPVYFTIYDAGSNGLPNNKTS